MLLVSFMNLFIPLLATYSLYLMELNNIKFKKVILASYLTIPFAYGVYELVSKNRQYVDWFYLFCIIYIGIIYLIIILQQNNQK